MDSDGDQAAAALFGGGAGLGGGIHMHSAVSAAGGGSAAAAAQHTPASLFVLFGRSGPGSASTLHTDDWGVSRVAQYPPGAPRRPQSQVPSQHSLSHHHWHMCACVDCLLAAGPPWLSSVHPILLCRRLPPCRAHGRAMLLPHNLRATREHHQPRVPSASVGRMHGVR